MDYTLLAELGTLHNHFLVVLAKDLTKNCLPVVADWSLSLPNVVVNVKVWPWPLYVHVSVVHLQQKLLFLVKPIINTKILKTTTLARISFIDPLAFWAVTWCIELYLHMQHSLHQPTSLCRHGWDYGMKFSCLGAHVKTLW